MTEERRKLLLSVLVYVTIIALVAFVLFHQAIVKQMRVTVLTQIELRHRTANGVPSYEGRETRIGATRAIGFPLSAMHRSSVMARSMA